MTIPLTREALGHVRRLRAHFVENGRPEAVRNLLAALEQARSAIPLIERHQPAPRPYPELAQQGAAWVRCGRYWVRYRLGRLAITGVFYDQADIPRRV